MKNTSKYIFPVLIALSALSVSASAAFYSVTGLSKLFAGAKLEVTVMAASLEVAKLIIASLLHQYWQDINKILRFYLSSAVVVLVLITSMGIYGFLTSAYQETYRKMTLKENQVSFLEQKKDFYAKDVARYDAELERISKSIENLSNTKANSIQVRDTTSSTGYRNTISTTGLRLAQSRIEAEEENRKEIQAKRTIVADSLQKYQMEILEAENGMDEAGELGPLKYIANLTGSSMDKVINILLLIIVFVFDPLAISMVVAASFAFKRVKEEEVTDDVKKRIEDDYKDFEAYQAQEEEVVFDDRDGVPTIRDVEDIEIVEEEVVEPKEKEEFYEDEIEDEYDEDHMLDEVLNEMVKDLEVTQVVEKSEPHNTTIEGKSFKVTPTTIKHTTGSIPAEEFRFNVNAKENEDWKVVDSELEGEVLADELLQEKNKKNWVDIDNTLPGEIGNIRTSIKNVLTNPKKTKTEFLDGGEPKKDDENTIDYL